MLSSIELVRESSLKIHFLYIPVQIHALQCQTYEAESQEHKLNSDEKHLFKFSLVYCYKQKL
jgi:hypothetical protein